MLLRNISYSPCEDNDDTEFVRTKICFYNKMYNIFGVQLRLQYYTLKINSFKLVKMY